MKQEKAKTQRKTARVETRAARRSPEAQARREKRRETTREEIKAEAWKQIAIQGAAALSLRAIATQMGLTPPALYRYYQDRDALVTALIIDAYNSFAEALEVAREACAPEAHAERFRAISLAYRQWAITYPQRYLLIFGTPVPGYCLSGEIGPAGRRSFGVLLGVLAEAYAAGRLHLPAAYAALTPELRKGYEALQKAMQLPFPPLVINLALKVWSNIHGFVSLELYGILPPFLGGTAEPFIRFEVEACLQQLGLK